jgi:hypothetical protein
MRARALQLAQPQITLSFTNNPSTQPPTCPLFPDQHTMTSTPPHASTSPASVQPSITQPLVFLSLPAELRHAIYIRPHLRYLRPDPPKSRTSGAKPTTSRVRSAHPPTPPQLLPLPPRYPACLSPDTCRRSFTTVFAEYLHDIIAGRGSRDTALVYGDVARGDGENLSVRVEAWDRVDAACFPHQMWWERGGFGDWFPATVYVRLEIWYKQAEDVGEGREDRETLKR